jgi:hypothetical protein
MPGEDIHVALRITNFSGQTLKFGLDNRWARFSLDLKDGPPVIQLSDVPLQGEFDLPSSTVATKRANLAPHFETLRPGRYTISAQIRLADWNRILEPTPVEFDVIQGTVLWEQTFGLPDPPEVTTPPELRRYVLQQAIHLKQMKLYVRVTDARGDHSFAVFPLGPMLTFSTPEKQIDRLGQLHLLYQYGARSFYYCIINPDGRLIVRLTYDYDGPSRPVLALNPQGHLTVRGGIRRPARDDYPPPPPPDPTPEINPANSSAG